MKNIWTECDDVQKDQQKPEEKQDTARNDPLAELYMIHEHREHLK